MGMQNAECRRQKANCRLQIADCRFWRRTSILTTHFGTPPTAYRLPPTTCRRGISLMEVLICIGVVAIGLVSIAALIPVGGVQVQRANTEERKATLGLNAFREFQIRGMGKIPALPDPAGLTPSQIAAIQNQGPWYTASGSPFFTPDTANHRWLAYTTPPFAIDPLMVTVGGSSVDAFPANSAAGQPTLKRLSLSSANNSALASAVFTSADDVISSIPEDSSQTGTSAMIYSDAPTNTIPIKRDFNGAYTWLATVTPNFPIPVSVAGSAPIPQPNDQYTLSIVVFDRRILTTPAPATDEQGQEEIVQAHWGQNSTSFSTSVIGQDSTLNVGGGEFTLSVDPSVTNATGKLGVVKPDQWLMLCRYLPNTDSSGSVFPWIEAKWYRVVAVADTVSPTVAPPPNSSIPLSPAMCYTRQVTLAGPDWESDPSKTTPPGIQPTSVTWPSSIPGGPNGSQNFNTFAVLLDGSVAVYQRVIHLAGNSVWNP